MKSNRQKKILELVSSQHVTTQEELQSLLETAGFHTTQATISRDIKELRLIKTLSAEGKYYYTTAPEKHTTLPININAVFLDSIKQIDFAGNFVVIKCYTGMANAVCVAIDTGVWEGLVGSIAGDDTIFLLLRTEEDAKELADFLTDLVQKS